MRFERSSSTRHTPLSLISTHSTSIETPSKSPPVSLQSPPIQKLDTIISVDNFQCHRRTVPLRSMSMASPIPKLRPLYTVAPTCLYHRSVSYPTRLDFQSILPSPRSRSSSPSNTQYCATLNVAQHTTRPPKTFLPLSVSDTKFCQTDDGECTACPICALTNNPPPPETFSRPSCGTKVSFYITANIVREHAKLELGCIPPLPDSIKMVYPKFSTPQTTGLAMLHTKLEPVRSTCR